MPSQLPNRVESLIARRELQSQVGRLRRRIDRRIDRLSLRMRPLYILSRAAEQKPQGSWLAAFAAGLLLSSLFSHQASGDRVENMLLGKFFSRAWKQLRRQLDGWLKRSGQAETSEEEADG